MSNAATTNPITTPPSPEEIVAFWLEAGYDKWFTRNDAFDAQVRSRFLRAYELARENRLSAWEETPLGALALVIVLDQFPRNMFRGTPLAFAADPQARAVADRAIARGFDSQVDRKLQGFFYLPFEHSENLADQERCIALYRAMGDADGLKWAEIHADIIRRFGRFPHRNPVLGRDMTPEEAAFLAEGGFAG
jgi:uncharacterized protein (DUF924 family)